jgi:6-pyruvoyltetrahydropterin/6-carboxytetrahydropterin synthase
METFGVRVYKEYFNFASAHFLVFADGAREELHGHNYQVRVRFTGAIGPDDMLLDFFRLKPIVKAACDTLDHRTLLPTECERLDVREVDEHVEATYSRPDGGQDRFLFPARDVVLLPLRNTSTERLAEHLARHILEAVRADSPNVKLTDFEVEVEESSGQCGVYGVALDGS